MPPLKVEITLPPRLHAFIRREVRKKKNGTPAHVVRDALVCLQKVHLQREKSLKELRESIDRARQQFERGEYITLTKENMHAVLATIKTQGRRRLATQLRRQLKGLSDYKPQNKCL